MTAALVVCPSDDAAVEELVKGWEFNTTTEAPHRLDLPALSTLGEDPFVVFKKFYCIYPHFSRVEL